MGDEKGWKDYQEGEERIDEGMGTSAHSVTHTTMRSVSTVAS